jgi:hypothetical protein
MTSKHRSAFVGAGVLIVLLGVSALLRGNLHYSNWWGGAVFATFAILIGGMAVGIGVLARRKQR